MGRIRDKEPAGVGDIGQTLPAASHVGLFLRQALTGEAGGLEVDDATDRRGRKVRLMIIAAPLVLNEATAPPPKIGGHLGHFRNWLGFGKNPPTAGEWADSRQIRSICWLKAAKKAVLCAAA